MWVYLAYIGLLPWTSTSCNIIRSSIGSHGHKSCQNDWNVDFWPKKAPISHVWGCGDGREKFLWVKWVVSGVREIQSCLTLEFQANPWGQIFFIDDHRKKNEVLYFLFRPLKFDKKSQNSNEFFQSFSQIFLL